MQFLSDPVVQEYCTWLQLWAGIKRILGLLGYHVFPLGVELQKQLTC